MRIHTILVTAVIGLGAIAGPCAAADLSGNWTAQVTRYGQPQYWRVILRAEGSKLSGTWNESTIAGTITGDRVEFSVKEPGGRQSGSFTGEVTATGISGQGKLAARGGGAQGELQPATLTMTRVPNPPAGGPKTWDFEPKDFYSFYSSSVPPALRVFPGDTVRTWTLDDNGIDSKLVRRSPGGNPQTGPFYVESALPGDTLVVKLNRVRLNRDSAQGAARVKANLLDPAAIAGMKYADRFDVEWKLDGGKGVARLAHPTERMKDYTVPVKPMLGCIGTAPPNGQTIRALDLGAFGGNMDYNQMVEGATLYLPVFQPGAMLFLGDGHAAMGDGEVTFSAVETSLDVEFTVDLVKGAATAGPRLENNEYLMAMGVAGSLMESVQIATSQMANWLKRDYRLSENEAAVVLGTVAKYDIAEMVDPHYNVVAKVPKSALASFK